MKKNRLSNYNSKFSLCGSSETSWRKDNRRRSTARVPPFLVFLNEGHAGSRQRSFYGYLNWHSGEILIQKIVHRWSYELSELDRRSFGVKIGNEGN